MGDEIRKIVGDGSDTLPLGTWYDALQRDGRVETLCCITPFCVRLGADLFRHHGHARDIVSIKVLEPNP